MSFAIVLLLNEGALVCADSRAMNSDGVVIDAIVQKILIVGSKAKPILLAFTGDGEINGRPTIEILRNVGEKAEPTAEGFDFILSGLKRHFEEDLKSYPWEDESDREKYIKEAKVVLHCLTSPNSQLLAVVTPSQIRKRVFQPGSNSSLSGMVRPIEEDYHREHRAWSLPLARAVVPQWIASLCDQKECGFPVQIAFWKADSVPSLTNLSNSLEVQEFLNLLS